MPFVMDQSKSKNGASGIRLIILKLCRIYLTYHLLDISIINMKASRYLEVELKASIKST